MRQRHTLRAAALAAAATAIMVAAPAAGQTVKITPLGSHDGDFCRFDRALVLEDPDGTRILYDAGRTVRGAEDERLGQIDAVLVSHMHGDHLGDRIQPSKGAGECGAPDVSSVVAPVGNSVNITVGKNAKLVVGSEMSSFLAGKVKRAGGDPKQVQLVRFGALTKVGGVEITTVPAAHSNGVNAAFIDGDLGELMKAAGLTAYVGPPTGYVLRFSNGLVAYLSGDTGITAEQDAVVRQHYGATLAVINIGNVFTTGPSEAAWVMNQLVQPKTVIASHANELATKDGQVIAGTKTEAFIKATQAPVHVPISGRTMEFDGNAACTAGC